MFPEEIIIILDKYKENNTESISNINKNIESITSDLYSINETIANKIKELLTDKNTDNNATELLQDSVLLRKYINTIKILNVSQSSSGEEAIHSYIEEYSEEIFPKLLFDKKVSPYLVDDDICPFCNVKLTPHTIYYQRYISGFIKDEITQWYRCPNCRQMFVLDYDAKDFDFENTNILLNKTKFDEIPPIDIYSVIILSNTLHCSLNHNTKDIIAKIPVLNEKGQISYLKINASYCFDCKRFTILKSDFNAIKDIIICRVIDETTNNSDNNSDDFEMEQKASILCQYGYNVQTKKDLSEQQRHIILSSVIEANIMNRRDVINHISTLIERGSKIQNWNEATNKWKSDRTFVSEYQSNCLPEIIFNNIILKYKSKSK